MVFLKTISIVFFNFDRFFFIYIYCRKWNAEFNKLTQTVAHRANYFSKNDTNTPNKSLSCNKTPKMLGLKIVFINRMSLHKKLKAKLVDEKNNRLFCCLSVRDFEPKILIKCTNLQMLILLFNSNASSGQHTYM